MQIPYSENLVLTEETFPIVLKMANSMPGGFFIYHADGDQQIIHFNHQLSAIYGCSNNQEFIDLTGNSFKGMVHPSDYRKNELDIRSQISSTDGDVCHVKYRFIKKDGSIGVLDDYGHLVHSEKYGDIYYVFVQDITEQYSVDNLNAIISALTEGYVLLEHFDFDTGMFEVYQSSGIFSKSYKNTFNGKPFAEQLEIFADLFVFEDDRQIFIDALSSENIQKMLSDDKPIITRIRINNENSVEWHELKVVHHVEHVGKKCAIIGLRNINEEILQRVQDVIEQNQQLEMQRNAKIIEILASEYSSVLYVDLTTCEMQITKMSDEDRALVGDSFINGMNYSVALNLWISSLINNSDAEDIKCLGSPEYIRELLRTQNTYTRVLRSGTEEEFRYNEIKIVKVNPETEATAFVVGIADRDEEIREEQKTVIERKRNTDIIEILASEYSSVYYIDLTTDGLNPYTMNEETETTFGSVFRSGITYSEAFKLYVDKLIFPEDKKMMLKAGSIENIRKELATKKTFLTTYRNSDNKYSEMKFVKVGADNDTPTAVALGFAEKDKLIRQELAAEQERQMNFDIIEILASEYSSVYYIDLTTDGLNPYTMNAETETTFGSVFRSGITYSEAFKLYVDKLIFPEDKKMMLKAGSIENIKKELATKKTFLTTYRNSDNKYSEMKFVKVGGDNDVPTAVALGFAEKDELIRQEQAIEQERQMNFDIIEILASEYSSVYYIDLTTDGLNPYTMNAETETTFGSVFRSGITYSEAFRLYVDKLVFPEDKSMMLKAGSIGNIMKELPRQKTFLPTYRNAYGHYSEMKFVKVGNQDGVPSAVALGFSDKDAELRAKLEEERILQRNIDIIEILASEYSSVYYIDMTTEELDPYTMNEQTETQFGQIFRSGIKYSDAFRLYVDTLVFSEDQQRMLTAGSVYNILKELGTKKTFITTYRDSDGKYCEMKFVKVGDDENPQAVALGFANRDDEIRSEMERKAITARDAAVISGLSDDFGCVVYANYNSKDEVHYRFDPFFEENIPGWSEIEHFDERLDTLVNTIMHPDDRKFFSEATRAEVVKNALKEDNVYYINFRTLINGETTYYQAKFVRDEHSSDHVIAGFHSVDDETKREMAALERAEAASKAKTSFLFNMSHDIRTPMNAILGYTDLAIRHFDDEMKAKDSLMKIKSSGTHLLNLINDILEMSRIEADKLEIAVKPIDILEAISNVDHMSQALAIPKSIDFKVNVGEIKNRYIYADELHFNEVLINIISNAIKYTANGGKVRYSISQTSDAVNGLAPYRFEISDNGIGMSAEFQEHIFEAFSRENSATVSKTEGAGLGLSIVKKIVDLSGGTIKIDSKPGEGSTFTVEMSFKVLDDEAIAEFEKNGSLAVDLESNIVFNGKKVLLVEDNELNREIAVEILTEAGLSVETAEDGKFAVDMVKKKGTGYYDFILMDIQMPVMNGYEATKLIRSLPDSDRLPIIALSANAFAEDKTSSIAAGMNAHVAKPINPAELFEVLANILEKGI